MHTQLKAALLISVTLTVCNLTGCYTSKDKMFPNDGKTMMEIFNGSGTASSNQQLLDARSTLRRSSSLPHELQEPYTRTAINEINSQFQRLPNPDLVMYVYPHLSGAEQVPVPGYSTVFPLYSKVQYALPGERTEDY